MKLHIFIIASMLGIVLGSSQTPIFNNSTYSCSQVNITSLSCQNGYPITIGFPVNAPANPLYGNFTLSQGLYPNITQPVNIFGGECKIQNGATATCLVTIRAFSVFSGNATAQENLRFTLTSDVYPQVYFYRYANFSIHHYPNRTQVLFISTYRPAFSNYLQLNHTYWNICNLYSICDAYIQDSLYSANALIGLAANQANRSIAKAYYNITVANSTLRILSPKVSNFTNQAGAVIINIEASNTILSNMIDQYALYKENLSRCAYQSGSSDKVNSIIANAQKYPKQTTISGSALYLTYIKNESSTEMNIINSCKGSGLASLSSLPSLGINSVASYLSQNNAYLIAIVVLMAAIYAWRRYHNMREIRRIRETHNKAEETLSPAQEESENGETK